MNKGSTIQFGNDTRNIVCYSQLILEKCVIVLFVKPIKNISGPLLWNVNVVATMVMG
jgi:hypothetical protein